jgi:phenylalanyl-tRNA synthetase beta chain
MISGSSSTTTSASCGNSRDAVKIPYRWIREFVDLPLTPEQAADRLINAGVEVAGITPIAPDVKGVVVGEIEAIERELGESHGHRLVLCRVRTGAERFQVVCGAPNAAPGVRSAFAPPGSMLPGGRAIGTAAIRGVASEGMLCSERELGLGEEHERGILVLEPDAPLGAELASHLRLDDVVLEIEITPNRPDCLSVVGIARELAALTGVPLRPPALALVESEDEARDESRIPTSVTASPRASSPTSPSARPRPGWRPACAPSGCGRSATSSTSRTTSCGRSASRSTRSTPPPSTRRRSSCDAPSPTSG